IKIGRYPILRNALTIFYSQIDIKVDLNDSNFALTSGFFSANIDSNTVLDSLNALSIPFTRGFVNKFLVESDIIGAIKLPEFLYSSEFIALSLAGIYPVSLAQVL